jgi:hypothetical protein
MFAVVRGGGEVAHEIPISLLTLAKSQRHCRARIFGPIL